MGTRGPGSTATAGLGPSKTAGGAGQDGLVGKGTCSQT